MIDDFESDIGASGGATGGSGPVSVHCSQCLTKVLTIHFNDPADVAYVKQLQAENAKLKALTDRATGIIEEAFFKVPPSARSGSEADLWLKDWYNLKFPKERKAIADTQGEKVCEPEPNKTKEKSNG